MFKHQDPPPKEEITTPSPNTPQQQEEELNCIICLRKEVNNPGMLLPCLHCNFCTHCIAMWLERSTKCPLCNAVATHLIHDIFSKKHFQITCLYHENSSSDSMDNKLGTTIMPSIPQHAFRHFIYYQQDPFYSLFNSNIHKRKINKSIHEKIQLEMRIKLFIKRELETIFRSYSIGMIQCHIEGLLSSPEFCYLKLINDWSPHLGNYSHGPQIELFEHQIESYLNNFTHHFIHELLLFCMSNITQPDRYDELVEYEKKSHLNFKKEQFTQ